MRKFNFYDAQERENRFMENPFAVDWVSVWGARVVFSLFVGGFIGIAATVITEYIKSR